MKCTAVSKESQCERRMGHPGLHRHTRSNGEIQEFPDSKAIFLRYKPVSEEEEELTIQDYKDVLEDKRKLVRKLDAILRGKDGIPAAKQASMVDLLGPARQLRKVNEETIELRIASILHYLNPSQENLNHLISASHNYAIHVEYIGIAWDELIRDRNQRGKDNG